MGTISYVLVKNKFQSEYIELERMLTHTHLKGERNRSNKWWIRIEEDVDNDSEWKIYGSWLRIKKEEINMKSSGSHIS